MTVRNTFRDNPSYIIREICEDTNISYNSVFKGLCSEKTVCKYKNGEKLFDIFIFNTILERLGISTDHFEMLVPERVHEFFLWYEKCLDYAENKDWRGLAKGIDDFRNIHLINERIQTSYRDFFNYILERYCNENMKSAYEYIKNALSATGIDLPVICEKNPLLSLFEWHLLINLCDMEILLKPEKRLEITEKLYEIYLCKIQTVPDENLKGRVIPKLALFILNTFKEKLALDKRLGIEKNTIKIMVKADTVSELPAILEFFIEDVESSCEESVYIRQCKAITSIFTDIDIKVSYNISRPNENRRRYIILSDYLKLKRKESGLTCEEVSESICSVENYQRIERGKIFPSTKTLISLVNRLGISFTFIKGDIEADSYKAFLLAKECDKLIAAKKFRSVAERLSELKDSINMDIWENLQFVRLLEIKMKEEVPGKKITLLNELFGIKEISGKRYIYTPTENRGLSLLAVLTGSDCIKILEVMLDNENKKRYVSWHNIKDIVRALIHLYKERGEYEKSKALADKALKRMFRENDVSILVPLLEDMAEIKERIKCDNSFYEVIFYIAELFELYADSRRIKLEKLSR